MPPKPATAKLSTAVERATPTAVATTERKATLRDVLESRREHVARALPAELGLTPDRLLMITETLVTANPDLGECAPRTLLGALMTTAQLGLEPGPLAHVYFLPRWNGQTRQKEVNFTLGYKGMVELARRAGVQIRTREVYEHDRFEIVYGLEDTVVHKPALKERGPVVGYYLVASWSEGGETRHYVLWMSRDDVEKARLRSDSGKTGKGPWSTDYDAMAKKTLVRRAFASNSIPTTKQMAQAVNVDDSVRREISAEAIDVTPVREEEPDEPQQASLPAPTDTQTPTSAVFDTLDAVPDDEEAIREYVMSLQPIEVGALYETYNIAVPDDEITKSPDFVDELVARIIERRVS